uniref:Transforming acidic coiled-coil-containing protein C-terminal domain-containing protein n=1 Tax=Panagrolaimus sp. ES5 TaxID=591445 RepID=A0AC34GX68_9BILA
MDKTFTKEDGLPDDDNEREEDSGNQQSDESLEMVNHSDISDPSNDNPQSEDIADIPNPNNTDKRDNDGIPGDPTHSIRKVLEGTHISDHHHTTKDSTHSSQPNVPIEDKVIQPLNSSLQEKSSNNESVTTTTTEAAVAMDIKMPIEADRSSKSSLEAFKEAEMNIKNDEIAENAKSISSAGSLDEDGNRKDRRRTYHVRHNTVTIASPENLIAKEIATILNELADSPPDALITILQKRFTEYGNEKENEWKAENERSFSKAKALLEMRQAFDKSNAAAAAAASSQPTSRPQTPPPSTIDIERLIRERDQSREHASATMRSLREIIRQQELLMDKEQSHSEHIRHIQNEQKETDSTVNQLHHRYNSLLVDAEEELLQADVGVTRVNRDLDDSMVTLRFKVRQQEMTIRSHETTVANLQAEKKELLDICEDLIASTEAKSSQITHTEEEAAILPSPQLPPEMDDLGGF